MQQKHLSRTELSGGLEQISSTSPKEYLDGSFKAFAAPRVLVFRAYQFLRRIWWYSQSGKPYIFYGESGAQVWQGRVKVKGRWTCKSWASTKGGLYSWIHSWQQQLRSKAMLKSWETCSLREKFAGMEVTMLLATETQSLKSVWGRRHRKHKIPHPPLAGRRIHRDASNAMLRFSNINTHLPVG